MNKLMIAAVFLFSFNSMARERVILEMNLYEQPESCLNLSSGEVFVPEAGTFSYIDEICEDLGYEYYLDQSRQSPVINASINASNFAKDLQLGDFAKNFPDDTFETVDDEIINFYLAPSGGKKGKGKGKVTFFRVEYADFGIFATYDSNNEFLSRGKIEVLDDLETIRVIGFFDNTAPVLTQINLTDELIVDERYRLTYDALLAASDATDAENDPLSFVIESLPGGTDIVLNGAVAMIGDIVGPGDNLTIFPIREGQQSILKVSVFDGELKSAVVNVIANVISKVDALRKELEKVQQEADAIRESIKDLSRQLNRLPRGRRSRVLKKRLQKQRREARFQLTRKIVEATRVRVRLLREIRNNR